MVQQASGSGPEPSICVSLAMQPRGNEASGCLFAFWVCRLYKLAVLVLICSNVRIEPRTHVSTSSTPACSACPLSNSAVKDLRASIFGEPPLLVKFKGNPKGKLKATPSGSGFVLAWANEVNTLQGEGVCPTVAGHPNWCFGIAPTELRDFSQWGLRQPWFQETTTMA